MKIAQNTANWQARAALLTALALGAATAPLPSYAQDYSFSSVTVEGNVAVDAATIITFAQIQQGATLTAAQLNDALQRVNDSGLFESVEFTPRGGQLVITVTELPIINVLDFQGNKRLDDEELAAVISSQARRVFSSAKAEADAAIIADLYSVRGRLAATVTPKIIPRDNGRVDLVFEIVEGRVVENESITFVGNRAFSDRRLRQVLQTKQAGLFRELIRRDTFDEARLELDKQLVRDFYLSRGYADIEILDASVDLARERDATFIAMTLQEGPRYSLGTVQVLSEVPDIDLAEYTAQLRMGSGDIYSPTLVDTNIARLEAIIDRAGLSFVQVEPRISRNPETQTLDIDLVLVRGERVFVERIDIEGNTTTIDQVVRRQFRTAEGDGFSPRDVRQAAERIRALGFFSDAAVNAQAGSAPDKVVVNVDLVEAPTGSISFGLTYGSNNGAGLALGFNELNFLGRGQALKFDLTTSQDTNEFTFDFVEPAFLGRDVRFKLGANYRATEEASASYDTETASLAPALEFSLTPTSRFEVRYRIARDEVVNNGSTSDVIIAESARGREELSALGYTYSIDSRTSGLNPNSGFVLRFGQDFAGLGGDVKYVSSTVFALAETKVLGENLTLRAIAEGGSLQTFGGYESRVTDRFFGAGKVRGFERNGFGPREDGDALGGNMFAAVRLEADFPLGLPEEYGISGGAFYDVGSVWGLDNPADAQGVDAAQRASAGLSVFWNTPIGPLRMNFSRPLSKESYDISRNFELTISTKF
jgi:outer membrane protein insertion porin family